jgi:nicotinamide mononucleotide transporter
VSPLEWVANLFNAAAIILAGRNSVHTWWTGIVGCALLGVLFWRAQLPADATLQIFFIGTSIYGWWAWVRGGAGGSEMPIRRTGARFLALCVVGAIALTLGYAWMIRRTTNAAAPIPDSAVLAFSVLGQLLLMARRIENWWCWLLVNTIAVPLYFSRGLYLTGGFYVIFWVNAVISLRHWRALIAAR